MPQLTALFKVPLSAPILIRSDGKPRSYSANMEEFKVTLKIAPDGGRRSKKKNERLWTSTCHEVLISVSREEKEPPPEIIIRPDGTHDVSVRGPYFNERGPLYRGVACKALNNAISFFKYELRQPLLTPLDEGTQEFQNPEWSDGKGNEINPGRFMFLATAMFGSHGEFGVRKFEGKHKKYFQSSLVKPKQVSLHQEILSDAQASAFEGNIRRAVLELAIACEVFAKHTFFGSTDNAAQVFEALEDKGKISVRVIDLIDIGGEILLNGSFKAFNRVAYNDIDYMFRARNKVAHRGEPIYRDEKGKLHTVDINILKKWWVSVQTLFSWAG